jgi:hypothetical protein
MDVLETLVGGDRRNGGSRCCSLVFVGIDALSEATGSSGITIIRTAWACGVAFTLAAK